VPIAAAGVPLYRKQASDKMMRSNNYSDDDDDFAPNPFRSGASVTSNGSADLLDGGGGPPAQLQQQQQMVYGQQQQQQQQQQMMYGQQQPQYGMQHQQAQFAPPQQQQFAPQQQPDPNSGMTGSFDYPSSPQNQQAVPPNDPSQFLTGTMDRNAGSFNNNSNQNQPPASIFSIRGITNMCCKTDQAFALFNVDSIDIYLRLKSSVLQFHQPDMFRTSVIGDLAAQQAANAGQLSPDQAINVPMQDRKGPDLYGPFWLSMTLMFVLGVTANLSDYLHHQRKADADAEFEYDITHLLHAAWIVFGYSFAVPTIFWFTCQCLGMPGIPWAMWVCCYGYSLTAILLGALCAWWLPYELWHWCVLAAASSASGLLILRNLSTPLLSQDAANHAKAAPVLLAILGAHVLYLLVLKITFYP